MIPVLEGQVVAWSCATDEMADAEIQAETVACKDWPVAAVVVVVAAFVVSAAQVLSPFAEHVAAVVADAVEIAATPYDYLNLNSMHCQEN